MQVLARVESTQCQPCLPALKASLACQPCLPALLASLACLLAHTNHACGRTCRMHITIMADMFFQHMWVHRAHESQWLLWGGLIPTLRKMHWTKSRTHTTTNTSNSALLAALLASLWWWFWRFIKIRIQNLMQIQNLIQIVQNKSWHEVDVRNPLWFRFVFGPTRVPRLE